jgi:hypothetical protein
VAARGQGQGQVTGNVGQTAGPGKGDDLGRDHQDIHGFIPSVRVFPLPQYEFF